jgi:hypothetical protein
MWRIFLTVTGTFALSVNSLDIVVPGELLRSGEQTVLTADGTIDVHAHMTQFLPLFKTQDEFEEVVDKIHFSMYGRCDYAPRVASRAAEDLEFCRDDIIRSLISTYNYRYYLEIGCFQDEVFSQIAPLMDVAVGVDPKSGGTLHMTSDQFFAQNEQRFDLVFIDGDHTAKQAIIDFQNALNILSESGSIVMHDCNPLLEKRQYQNGGAYNGDVWKIIGYLRGRQDLEVVTVDIDHGVAVVQRRRNLHPLPDELQRKLDLHRDKPLEAFTYDDLRQHRAALLRLVSVAEFRAWLLARGEKGLAEP